VNFTFVPECFSDGGCAQAELFFNSTVYVEGGTNEWSNSNLVDMDRAVLRDHMAFGIHWTSGPCTIMVFNFTTGELIEESPQFGDLNPSTAPTLDPNNPDIVYGFSGDGEVVRYNMSSDSFEWETDISHTSSRVFWPNFVPLYNGYLYIAFNNCSLCQVDASNGSVLRWLELDSGISEMQSGPRVDYNNGVLYVQDATSLRKLNAVDLSEFWSVNIGNNCLFVESGAYSSRFTPLLVNDSFTGGEEWIITQCASEQKIFAINKSGYEMWNRSMESKIRSPPCYHPDRGWIYLNKFTFTDGKVYVLNITDGSFVFNFTYPNNYPSNRNLMLTKKYVISKTDRGSGVTDYLYVFDNSNGSLVGSVNIGTQRFHCDPLITSAGYTLITHSYADSVNLWKLGEGEYSDYNPYLGTNGYQYMENGLTRFGFETELWESRKINETPVVNNTENGIVFDFSGYSLPNTFRWNIKVTDSDGYSCFADEDWVVFVRLPPVYGPVPVDGATDVDLSPVLSVAATDYEGEALDVLFRTNASTGLWHTIGQNLSVMDTRVYCSNTSEMGSLNTTYWWSVNATDGEGNWTNRTYSFSTLILLSNWPYRKMITINHTEVAADLTNFPVLIQINYDGDLASHAQSDFDDILFTNSSVNWFTGSPRDRLNHEIEMYDSGSGNLTVWVNVTDLSSTSDTVLYMYYGNLNCESQENAAGTWSSDYAFVFHLNETSGSHFDSTGNNNVGTPLYGTVMDAAGWVDGADSFDGVDDLVDVAADSSHDLWEELSVSMWIKPDVTYDSSLSNHLVLLNRQQPEGDDSYILLLNNDGRLHLGSYGGNIQSTQDVWLADTWYYVVATYRSDLSGELYINGSEELLAVDNYDSMSSVVRNVEIGDAPGPTYIGFDGVIDDVRVLNKAVGGDWVATEYSNQLSPGLFYFVGLEEVPDLVPPEIGNVVASPDPQFVGGYVNITCDVIDVGDVDEVWVNITYPDASFVNVSMLGGSYYYNNLYTDVGTYQYFIWAIDTIGNTNTSAVHDFHIFLGNWSYYKKIIINHTKVDADLTNFPIMFYNISSDFSSHAQPDGDDFVFLDVTNTTQYNHEIEYYNSSSGELVTWVNITDLSSTADTILWLKYGNVTYESQENVPGTWDSNFKMIHHLEEIGEAGSTRHDSIQNVNLSVSSLFDGNATGIADGADDFEDTNPDYLENNEDNGILDLTNFTVELWDKPETLTHTHFVFEKRRTSYNNKFSNWVMVTSDTGYVSFTMGDGASTYPIATGDGNTTTESWHYYVGTFDTQNNNQSLYVDGELRVYDDDATQTPYTDENQVIRVGNSQYLANRDHDGILDEIRVSNVARSISWINTTYNTIRYPNDFLSVGSEQTILPIDTIQPTITKVDAQPNPQIKGGYVNITCNVTDNIGVDKVFLNIVYPDASFENFSISTNKTGNTYYCNRIYVNGGTYSYFIWANDTIGNSDTSAIYSFSIICWQTVLNISAPNGKHDNLVFGEVDDASDGQDSYDVPKPGTPPSPYLYAWFYANLSEPYNKLWRDYRFYPDTYKVWDMYIDFENTSSDNVTINWDAGSLSASEYTSIMLNDLNSSVEVDMIVNSSYTYVASSGNLQHFQIVCSIVYFKYNYSISLGNKWNLVSLPVNQSIHKDEITVNYLGVNYTWQQAVENGTVDDSIFGWNAINQNYFTTNVLEPGRGHWMYAYDECTFWISSNISNDDDYITDLNEKWNLVGLPFYTSIDKENFIVYCNETYYTWQQAVENGTVDDSIFGWNTAYQSYDLTDILEPGKGHWMYAYYECILIRAVN